jgi:Leucine-rich repeat (LRR) protein
MAPKQPAKPKTPEPAELPQQDSKRSGGKLDSDRAKTSLPGKGAPAAKGAPPAAPTGGAPAAPGKGAPPAPPAKGALTAAVAAAALAAPAKGAPQPAAAPGKGGKLATVVEQPSAQQGPKAGTPAVKVINPSSGKKVEYLSEEIMNRKPLAPNLLDALIKKCGPPMQEVKFDRNEAKPPPGRNDDLAPSRHEHVPPCRIVLMFNCFEASFELSYGDISSLPEADMTEIRSLTSGKIIGRVRLSPDKGTPLAERVIFNDSWFLGSEHGLEHDGLQTDGYIFLRLDWRDQKCDQPRAALIRVNPWLAYGCGEGARVGLRKPGATESTAATVQRWLRDDTVVSKRDGTDNEVTVDPTPFTMVLSSNPRYKPGTRLLILYEGSCVDAMVEPFPVDPTSTGEWDVKIGSRHYLKVDGKLISGWITSKTADGSVNLDEVPQPGGEAVPEDKKVWALNRKKALVMTSGCNASDSEKVGSLTNKMQVRILEAREMEDKSTRCYVCTIPSQSSLYVTIALNAFNHSPQRFPSVAEYESARCNYCEDIVVKEAMVEDAITGNHLRIKDQTLHISTATEALDNTRVIPAEWKVSSVLDLCTLLLVPSPNRANGSHASQPVLVRAGPGTGKTWMAKQAVYTLADRLLRGSGMGDGIRLVPIVVFVQRIIYLLREKDDKKEVQGQGERKPTLLERYIESVYSGKKYESWCTMLMQAYDMRALVVLLDGVDEAAGLRDQIEEFVHKEVVPSGNRVLVTSRPEGVRLETYNKTFIVMNLNQLTNEQQRRVINIQMEGNVFFDHLLSLGEVRKNLDDAYRKIGAVVRNDLETLWGPHAWQYLVDGKPMWDPARRQKNAFGSNFCLPVRKPSCEYLIDLDKKMFLPKTATGVSPLGRVEMICATKAYVEGEFEAAILEGFCSLADINSRENLPIKVAVQLGVLYMKQQEKKRLATLALLTDTTKSKNAKTKAAEAAAKKAEEEKKAAARKAAEERAAALEAGAEGGEATEGVEEEEEPLELLDNPTGLWKSIMLRTDELYIVHEKMNPTWKEILKKFVIEVARDDPECKKLEKDIQFGDLKDPIKTHTKALELYADRFNDNIVPETCVSDVTRARIVLQTGTQIKDLVNRLTDGIELSAETRAPVYPSMRAAQKEKEEADQAAVIQPGPTVLQVNCMFMDNKFDHLDPTHFRFALLQIEVAEKLGVNFVSIFCELEVHFHEILTLGQQSNGVAIEHYNFFRQRLKGSVPVAELDRLLEEKLIFLVDATGIPVLLSLLVLIFTSGGEDLTKLPSNRIELYEIGIDSAVSKRLLPGNRASTDLLIHDWLRLFNLDRSALSQTVDIVGPVGGDAKGGDQKQERKEREHRPTRKAALSMELANDTSFNEKKVQEESSKEAKKKNSDQSGNKDNKKLLNLDAKEVYEVFRHGSHYLREAAKPEVQRTELNRIELTMPKKLVDTVMMLVNANLKMLLGNRAQMLGLTMLRHIAVSNQLAGRREFSAVHVATALLIDQVNTEGLTLWMHLNKEDAGIPLTKTLEAQTELAPAQYQFKHLSFQEGLFAQDLLIKAEAGWETWETDLTAAEFLNNPFMNNTCRIAAGYLGTRLAKRRPNWDFSKKECKLSEVGLIALWLICENNEKIKQLDLRNNGVGTKIEDSTGLSRMLSTSTALTVLDLGNNCLGDLKGYLRPFGRGLSSNKTLIQLDLQNNRLLPDGIKIVCTALRTCTALKILNLSNNSPGREITLSLLLQFHPTLQSVGVIEKEPTTRAERTWWLDTRAKEAIGKALLLSKFASIHYVQCDVFTLTDKTEVLSWTSQANCDAIVLAGVLRSNSVLKALNIGSTGGEIGDYEREAIGLSLIANINGKLGYSDMYGLKESMSPTHRVDLKEKDQIRSRRSFTLFAGLLRANSTLTTLTLASLVPEQIEVLADALSTNTTLVSLILEQPSKTGDTAFALLPIQELNGMKKMELIDLFEKGYGGLCVNDNPAAAAAAAASATAAALAGGPTIPMHRQACAFVGAILGASMAPNRTIQRLKINPGGGSEGGAVLDHLHKARRSSLLVLDLTDIGLGERGGTRFFESMLAGKCPMLKALHLGSNKLTDLSVGQLIVEVLRSDTCNISTLDLHDNQLGAPVMVQSLKYNRSLTSLNITGNPIDDDGLFTIGGLLLEQDCKCAINSISVAPFEIPHGSDKIAIHEQTLGAGATRLMFGVLKYNTLIKKLDLKNRGITPSAASILAVAVTANTVLQSIDLSGNPIVDVSQYTGDKPQSDSKGLLALSTAVQKSSSVEAITLEGGTLPVDQLKGVKKVRILDLSRKNLSLISAYFMGTLLSGNNYMTELVLHTNDLTPNGVKIVVKQITTAMKTIDVANAVKRDEKANKDKGTKSKWGGAVSAAKEMDVPPHELEQMWSAISDLPWLDKLTLDKDLLTALPMVGKIIGLKHLSAANNKLSMLPSDINLIRGMRTLQLNGNHLFELTHAVGELEQLERLDVRVNKLQYLPTTVSKLRSLKQLDVSENMLQTLDPSICDLHAIEKAEFKDNPLVRPPMAIARQGLGAVRKYFQEVVTAVDIRSYSARCVILGHAESGKTTLVRALKHNIAQLPLPAPSVYESTNHVSIETITLGEGAEQVALSVWDLQGSLHGASTTMRYLSENSLFMLTVPALGVVQLTREGTEYVERWLSYLRHCAPTVTVIPVLTKCDIIKGHEVGQGGSSVPLSQQLENAAAPQLAWFNEQLDKFSKLHAGPPGTKTIKILRPILCVQSVSGGESSIAPLREKLEGLMKGPLEEKPLPHVGQIVTRNAFLTAVFIRALRDGREFIDSARAADIGYIPSTMSAEQKNSPKPFLRFEDMAMTYVNEFVPALKLTGADERVLRDQLKLLQAQGEIILDPTGRVVFLDREYLIRMFKPMCDSRLGNRLWLSRTIAAQDALRALYGRPLCTEFEKIALGNSAENFEKTGEIHEELIINMWDALGLPVRREDYGQMISMLCTSGLIYLADKDVAGGRRWVVPMRVPPPKADLLKEQWLSATAEAYENEGKAKTVEVLTIALSLGRLPVTGLFESLISSCDGLGSWVESWRTPSGTGATLNAKAVLPGVSHLMIEMRPRTTSETKDGLKEWELAIEGLCPKTTRRDAWASVMLIKSKAQSVIDSIVGVAETCRASFVCPGCKGLKDPEPFSWALEDVLARAKTCEKCNEQVQLNTASLNSGISSPKLLVMEKALNSAPREIKVRDCL